MSKELDDWISRIRDRDAMTHEEAYFGKRPTGPEVLPRLVAEMHRSPDGYTRGKFAELLGEMGDKSVVPELIAELKHEDSMMRVWAVLGLEQIGDPQGVVAAKLHREAHPGEV